MRRLVLALALIASPLAAQAHCAATHEQQAMTCAEGSMYDQETRACVPLTTS